MRMANSGNEGFCNHEGCKSRSLPNQAVCADHLAVPAVPVIKEVKSETLKERVDVEHYDIVKEGSRRAERLIAEEEAARIRFWQEQADRSPGAKMKKRPPMRMSAKRPRRDLTAMVDPVTKENLAPAHMATRWVRETDDSGNPSDTRVEQYKEDGYEVITTSEGQPLRGIFGVAMKAPIDAYAQRIALNMPVGALNRNALLADADEAVRDMNRAAGDHVVSLVKEADHKRQRVSTGPSETLVSED